MVSRRFPTVQTSLAEHCQEMVVHVQTASDGRCDEQVSQSNDLSPCSKFSSRLFSLQELADFIKLHDKGLSVTVNEGDYESLVEVMAHLGAVREKQPIYDVMFEPLKQKLELLKSYGQEINDDVYDRLNSLPEKWANTKKLALNVKQQVAPLQTNEVANLRRKVANFDVRQYEFREKFRKELPFAYDQTNVYKKLDQGHLDIATMEREMQMLNDSAALFEVTVPDFKQVKQCRKEIKLLKQLWDYIYLVRTTFDDWKKTKWREINAEAVRLSTSHFTMYFFS